MSKLKKAITQHDLDAAFEAWRKLWPLGDQSPIRELTPAEEAEAEESRRQIVLNEIIIPSLERAIDNPKTKTKDRAKAIKLLAMAEEGLN